MRSQVDRVGDRPRFWLKGVSRLRFQVNRAKGNLLVLVKGDRQMGSQVNRVIGFG
jgi:predicted ABC-type transport system involved in lysophospholipase L1 biosynthesis ATPase subunit